MTAQPSQDATLIWRKSSVSMGAGECVEVATIGAYVLARDSRDQSLTVLRFTSAQWRGLVHRIKNDETGRG